MEKHICPRSRHMFSVLTTRPKDEELWMLLFVWLFTEGLAFKFLAFRIGKVDRLNLFVNLNMMQDWKACQGWLRQYGQEGHLLHFSSWCWDQWDVIRTSSLDLKEAHSDSVTARLSWQLWKPWSTSIYKAWTCQPECQWNPLTGLPLNGQWPFGHQGTSIYKYFNQRGIKG